MSPVKPTKKTRVPADDETVIHVMTTNPLQQHDVSIAPVDSSPSKKGPVLGVVLLLLLLGIGAYSFSGSKSSTSSGAASLAALAPAQVSITGSGFMPATVTIKVGQAVTWVNTDTAPHVIASDPYPTDNALAGFDSQQNLSPNDHYSFAFDKAGTYTYHDDLNPYTLAGTVIFKH
ncbi:MAG TPA: cupredoxin domain-containing protein [Candidatus Dormibacteraeota bacterium]|nr:cupredoxin domain-containing protein [Candidatus Dormibacteraeota bacterium]